MNKNFTRYVPGAQEYKSLINLGVVFLEDDEGNDWYEISKKSEAKAGFVVYDSDGVVVQFETDISKIWPENFNFGCAKSVPKNWSPHDPSSVYIFDADKETVKEKTYSDSELKDKADKDLENKIKNTVSKIAPLQYAEDLGISTDEEKERLLSWKKYIVELGRVKGQETYPKTINWPTEPE